jgi:hypothetical protein
MIDETLLSDALLAAGLLLALALAAAFGRTRAVHDVAAPFLAMCAVTTASAVAGAWQNSDWGMPLEVSVLLLGTVLLWRRTMHRGEEAA